MKRSELNKIMKNAVDFMKGMNFHLPAFAFWGPEEWKNKGHEYDEIRDNMLGWDITDFGQEEYYDTGLLMFTLRNGNYQLDKYEKPYAEKVLIVEDSQVTPYHFHWNKMEDIINRGGGNLVVKVFNSTEDEKLADTPVEISKDGKSMIVDAGQKLKLTPGESITITSELYHSFWAEEGTGKTLVGEVSKVNDDTKDNRFLKKEKTARFPEIIEDEEPVYLLAIEYPAVSE